MRYSRRDWLVRVGAAAVAPTLVRAEPNPRGEELRVAAILTTFFHRSHAHVILENFLEDYVFNGERTRSGCRIASMYVDQFHPQDMARDVARQYGIPIHETIESALCQGGDRLDVDGVLSIGEHGDYPSNEKGQRMYPRKRFFDAIAKVCRESGRGIPVFNDKHLSYRWDWAKEMFDTAAELGMPLMAGSSVPLAQRRPPLDLPADCRIESAVSIHGGPVESYDFHGLEVLQSMVEGRHGAETGVREVRFLEGDALWAAADKGLWSEELADAAMAAELGANRPTLRKLVGSEGFRSPPHGILVRYRDGLDACVLSIGSSGIRWNFACRLVGDAQPRATSYDVGPWQNRCLFKALSHAIQTHFRERQAPYPAERTLLTTGILDAAMDSRLAGGATISTPGLDVSYRPRNFDSVREMGKSWQVLPPSTSEPMGIHRMYRD